MDHSTISGNRAGVAVYDVASGGGIENVGGELTVRNTTIYGNMAEAEDGVAAGGGISGGAKEILNVTIAANRAIATAGTEEAFALGGGLFFTQGLKNSIVAPNTAAVGTDVFAAVSQGFNLIGNAGADSIFTALASDLINPAPSLGSYTDSGTPGAGHLPVPAGSPARDSADPAACSALDQLGYHRLNICERGAVEYREGPFIRATPFPLAFGIVALGNSQEKQAMVDNGGLLDLVLGTIGQADPLAAPFSITADNCSGMTLPGGGHCTLTIRFTPGSPGIASDSFDIPSNDPTVNTLSVPLSGGALSYPLYLPIILKAIL
jgi:hypothetical protein